jgi:hypothetical protein
MVWNNIGDVLGKFSRRGTLKTGFFVVEIKNNLKNWFDVDTVFLKKDILTIKSENAILAQEIFSRREEVRQKLNEVLSNMGGSAEEIKEIIVKVGK